MFKRMALALLTIVLLSGCSTLLEPPVNYQHKIAQLQDLLKEKDAKIEELKSLLEIPITEIQPLSPPPVLSLAAVVIPTKPEKIELVGYFENASKTLPENFRAELSAALARYKEAGKKASLLIRGYSDKKGNYDFNLMLSKDRAKATMSEILSISTESDFQGITIAGMGISSDNTRKVVVTLEFSDVEI